MANRTRSTVLSTRLTESEWFRAQLMATRDGLSLAAWVRRMILDAIPPLPTDLEESNEHGTHSHP